MTTPSRWRIFAGILAVSFVGCHDSTAVDPTTLNPSLNRVKDASLAFDWSMPSRFGDVGSDGLVIYRRTPEEINPASWTVNFDACKLPSGARYTWHVNEREVESVSSCTWTHEFPTEGTYNVKVHVNVVPGPGYWVEQVVTVQDWLVVSFGDSYASGEGTPEIGQVDDATFASLNAAMRDMELARQHLDAARANLQEAFEQKGLAESILATQQQRLNDFLDACTIDSFKDIAGCAQFLGDLPYDTFQTARAHFQEGVDNAQERVNSLTQAFQEAQAAFNAAQSAVANLQATIAQLRNGFREVRWQPSGKTDGDSWGGSDCHRSANSAPARAALALERSDPHTSVTFVHLACSGAQVNHSPGKLDQQIPKAKGMLGSREIDAVLLSIGGNDAGFAGIATACVLQEPCFSNTPAFDPNAASPMCDFLDLVGGKEACDKVFKEIPDQSANEQLSAGLAELPARYDLLAETLFPTLDGLFEPQTGPGNSGGRASPETRQLRSSRVYISQYVDMTKNDSRAYCQFDPFNLAGTMPGISPAEMSWLDVTAGQSINEAVATAAAKHGWSLVTHIYDSYAPHGYCAATHWVNRIHESFITQGDINGLVHPNNFGQVRTGEAILATLIPDLYPLGTAAAPRAPDQAFSPGPGTAAGGGAPQG